MSQSWQEGDDTDAKKLVRSQSAPPIRSDPIPEQNLSRQIKRVGSENPKALTRRRSSFRAGGSKYKKDPDSASATLQRRESKTIFADELGSALEEPHQLEQSYYKPMPGQEIQADELSVFHIDVDNDNEWGEDPVLKVVPVHLYGTIVLVGNAVQFNQQHSEAVARVLRASNENGEQSFQPKQLKKAPIGGYEKLIWKCNSKKAATHVMEDLKACSELKDFNIELLSSKPMDFIATDSNIVGLVRQLRSQGRTVPADRFFCSQGRTLADLEMAQQYKNSQEFSTY